MSKYLATNKQEFLILEFMGQAKKILAEEDVEINDTRFQEIKGILGNNMNYIGLFTKYFFQDNIPIDSLERVFKLFKTYSQLMKNRNINPLETIEDRVTGVKKYRWELENLEDAIQNSVINNENQKFVKKFISNKYKFLVNKETIDLFGRIREISKEENWKDVHQKIQSLLMEKIAAYRTPTQLNEALSQMITNLEGGWDVDTLRDKIETAGGSVEWNNDFVIIADTKEEFDICKKLGPQKWCIVRDRGYFDKTYVSFPNKQYIIYDTTLDRTSPRATIGVTITYSGTVKAAHDLNDHKVDNDYFRKWMKYMPAMTKKEMVPHLPDLTPDEMAKYGFTDEFLEMIELGNINIDTDKTANKFFLYGIRFGHTKLANYMSDNYNVDFEYPSGTEEAGKPIKAAAAKGNEDIFYWLVDKGVNLAIDDNYPIGLAAENGHENIVKFLLSKPEVDPSDNGDWAILKSARNGHLNIVKMLMDDKRVDPSSDNNKAIRLACSNGHLDTVKLLLTDDRVELDDKCLFYASMYNHDEMVRLLIRQGLNPGVSNQNLLIAIKKDNYKVIKVLLEDPRVNPRINNNFLLNKAKGENDDKILALLKKRGVE